jgi:hypothetical protein
MAIESGTCPICGWDVRGTRLAHQDGFKLECDLCGNFVIERLLDRTLETLDADDEDRQLLPYLRAYIRQANVQGSLVQLDRNNWRDYARGHRNTPVSQKVIKLLKLVADRTPFPGAAVKVNDWDYPLIDAASHKELEFFLGHLEEQEYLRCYRGDRDKIENLRLMVNGWHVLQPDSGAGIPGRCFVAMSFDSSLDEPYDHGIRAAVKDDCGFNPIRIDKEHHNEKICDKIIAEIRQCQFMVADFTMHKAGVYFEAGYAMGLGRPVIFTCRKDHLDGAHFDTRQYNHLVWETPTDLRPKLADRIQATIPRK